MPKSMIFLFDGTANDASNSENRFSNVYAINQLIADRKIIKSKDGSKSRIQTQITFYLPGVGTKFTVRDKTFWRKTGALIFGDGVDQMILRAYVNLSANYYPGDEIIVIGFSRGAAAARIFSRLISDFGILCSGMLLHLDELWHEFTSISVETNDKHYEDKIDFLRGDFAQRDKNPAFHKQKGLPIKFLGLFDTVVGLVDNKTLDGLNFRDEHPAKGVQHIFHLLSMHETRPTFPLKRFAQTSPRRETLLTFEQIWMPCVHSDVGGGYEEDFISNVALLTMCDKLKDLGGVAIQQGAYGEIQKRIATKIQNKKIVVNAERVLGPALKRKILEEDEIHPLHWYLINKPVTWKADQPPTTYVDRVMRNPSYKDKSLKNKFDRWIK